MSKKVIIPTEVLLAALQNFSKMFPEEANWETITTSPSPLLTYHNTYPPKRFMEMTKLTKGQWQRYKRTAVLRGSEKKAKLISIWANPYCHALYKAYLIKLEPS